MIAVRKIRLDASTHCQLKCPTCPTAEGKIRESLGSGHLSLDLFRRLVDDNPRLAEIELSNWGEIFLNPNLIEILRYAYEKNVALSAGNGANLNHAKPEVLEALVRYRFRKLTVSIDGATQESYEKYRRNGDIEQVFANIGLINSFKKKHRSEFPILSWQFIVMETNEREILPAKERARELGMHIFFKTSWDESLAQFKDPERVRRESGLAQPVRAEYERATGRPLLGAKFCRQLWNGPQINWDGRILGCCYNSWADFGRVGEERLERSLNNPRLTAARTLLTGGGTAEKNLPCENCSYFHAMKKDGDWLRPGRSARDELTRAMFYSRPANWAVNRVLSRLPWVRERLPAAMARIGRRVDGTI